MPVGVPELKIDFGEQENVAPEESPKAMGGTELVQKWLFSRLDPDLKNYFQWIASRKRKLEDKPRLFWVHDLAQDPEVQFLKEDPNAMLQFEKIIFVSHWQQYQYGVYLGVPYDHRRRAHRDTSRNYHGGRDWPRPQRGDRQDHRHPLSGQLDRLHKSHERATSLPNRGNAGSPIARRVLEPAVRVLWAVGHGRLAGRIGATPRSSGTGRPALEPRGQPERTEELYRLFGRRVPEERHQEERALRTRGNLLDVGTGDTNTRPLRQRLRVPNLGRDLNRDHLPNG